MRYTEVERRLRSLEAVVGDEAEPLSPDELCAAVLAEYSDLTPAEVCALDPPAFWAFLEWTGQRFFRDPAHELDPYFEGWLQRMSGNPAPDIIARLLGPSDMFTAALHELAGGTVCGQELIAPFLARSVREHPDRIRWLGPRLCRLNAGTCPHNR